VPQLTLPLLTVPQLTLLLLTVPQLTLPLQTVLQLTVSLPRVPQLTVPLLTLPLLTVLLLTVLLLLLTCSSASPSRLSSCLVLSVPLATLHASCLRSYVTTTLQGLEHKNTSRSDRQVLVTTCIYYCRSGEAPTLEGAHFRRRPL
jgi:hypothetical protein